jgi:hypothetical protein
MSTPYEPPSLELDAFNCPTCGAYAKQSWGRLVFLNLQRDELRGALCARCGEFSLWYGGRMIVPAETTAPPPSPDMPGGALPDYNEARTVFATSPRSSAALLRLVIQKLVIHLGQPGKNLNDDIGALVANGLPVKVQQSLDVVRVVGNNAVHPGQMDLNDDPRTASQLFTLVNLIVDVMITQPAAIEAAYQALPASSLAQVRERDHGTSASRPDR